MNKYINLAGQRFGKLLVIKRAGKNKQGYILWECLCDCGNIKIAIGTNLRVGRTKSCGCLNKEIITTHGMYGTPTYISWKSMIQRCNDSSYTNYRYYGGRGIKVCKEWISFENFYADMGERPEGLTLERINNNKGYSSDNCKWATRSEQSRNQRNKNNKTGFKGVNWRSKYKKYEVRIMANGKRHHIGLFKIFEQAVEARKQAEEIY